MTSRHSMTSSDNNKDKEQDKEQEYYQDSGILSGNIDHSTDTDSASEDEEQDKSKTNSNSNLEDNNIHIQDSMRLDSGINLSEYITSSSSVVSPLSDTFHKQLNIRNNLSQDNNTQQLHHINIQPDNHDDDDNDTTPTTTPLWQIYYAQDDDGDTQLHIAIMQRLNEAIYALLDMCPNPALLDIRNDDGQAPIHLAVLTQQPHIVRRLLIAGAKVNTTDFNGNTALHMACSGGDRACLTALTIPLTVIQPISGGNTVRSLPQALDQKNYDGEACVHLAVMGGYLDVLKHLVWFGANINATENKSGRTVLHVAMEQNNMVIVNYLVRECPMVWLGARTYSGHTALQLIHGNYEEQRLRQLFSTAGYNYQDEESDYDSEEEDEDDDSDISEEIHFTNSNYLNHNMRLSEVNVA